VPGSVQAFQLPIANNPALAGMVFYLQVAELDFSAGWVGTYTTNALRCTIGSFAN
jgi:hypothetical protein